MKKIVTPARLPANRQPTLRVTTRPNDANKSGDIFGGWLMAQIDIAGAIAAATIAKGAVVTVAVKELQFIRPLFIYDVVSFYTEVKKTGRTSVTIFIEVYAERNLGSDGKVERISEATLVYVAVSAPGVSRELPYSKN